jgi:hypothetical protein
LENLVKGFVAALADRPNRVVSAPVPTTIALQTNASATATASPSTAQSTATARASDAKNKSESGWDLIRKLVKLLRTKGNQYGYAVGVRYQEWCRWHGKRDTLKGLTRVVGVRPDAWATNAKHVLLSIRNGLDTFFEWLAVQKDQDSKEQSANGLERSVRNACRDPRTVRELWAIAVFSDGLFQPLMVAINEDDRKCMCDMRSVALWIRHCLVRWSCAQMVDALHFAWLMGHARVKRDTTNGRPALCSSVVRRRQIVGQPQLRITPYAVESTKAQQHRYNGVESIGNANPQHI